MNFSLGFYLSKVNFRQRPPTNRLTCVDKNELVILCDDGPAFSAILLAEFISDADWLDFSQEASSRVALLDAREPIAVVALQVGLRRYLRLVALDLLATENVGVFGSHVIQAPMLKGIILMGNKNYSFAGVHFILSWHQYYFFVILMPTKSTFI